MNEVNNMLLHGFLATLAFITPARPDDPVPSPLFANLREQLPLSFASTSVVAFADVDGDGDLDAYVGAGTQDVVLRNDGTAYFETGAALPAQAGTTRDVVFGDVDGDLDLDAITVTGGDARLLVGSGAGAFTDAIGRLPASAEASSCVALGDVDGDGDLDVVVGTLAAFFPPTTGRTSLFLNDGSGAFSDASGQLPGIDTETRDVALVDIDGDLDLDLVLANATPLFGGASAQDRLFLNDGSGTFADATSQLPVDVVDSVSLAAGDVDGDLDADLVVGVPGQPNRLWLNDGAGQLSDGSAQLPPDADETRAVALADVDGDGDLDLVAAGLGPNRLYRNGGAGTFVEAVGALPPEPASTPSIALGDLDGDGDLDALAAASSLDKERLYLNDGGGTFVDVTSPVPGRSGGRDAAVADLDSDGDADVFVLSTPSTAGGSRVYVNDGTGGLAVAADPLPPLASEPSAIALGDVDGDGDADALIGNGSATANQLLVNDGGGAFVDASALLPALALNTADVALADVDGDGDLDALIGNTSSGFMGGEPNHLHLNDGAGSFADASGQLPPLVENTSVLAPGDVDGDGDVDLIVGNLFAPAHLHVNDGSGSFADAPGQLPGVLILVSDVALGDLDGDGDLDALLTGSGDPTRLWSNDGAGTFADASGQLPGGAGATSVRLGDVDGDGDLDVLIDDPFRLLENDGAATFAEASGALPPDAEHDALARLADLDLDGDPDAFLVGFRPDRVWTNVRRQAARRNVPRVGYPLVMDVYGSPGSVWVLGCARAPGRVELPALGTLHLDVASLRVVGSGLLDGAGRASRVVDVPDDATLVGQAFYWQAVAGTPPRLANPELTTLDGGL